MFIIDQSKSCVVNTNNITSFTIDHDSIVAYVGKSRHLLGNYEKKNVKKIFMEMLNAVGCYYMPKHFLPERDKVDEQVNDENYDKHCNLKTVTVKRNIETATYRYEVGDQISIEIAGESHTATAVQEEENSMLFLLDECLDEAKPMNATGTTEGGYEASDLRKYLQEISGTIPDGLREKMIPFENGDLLRLLSMREAFGVDEKFEKVGGQIEWMKDRRHRIAMRKNCEEWYWLSTPVSASHFAFVGYAGNATAHGASASLGVRPVFLLRQP